MKPEKSARIQSSDGGLEPVELGVSNTVKTQAPAPAEPAADSLAKAAPAEELVRTAFDEVNGSNWTWRPRGEGMVDINRSKPERAATMSSPADQLT